MDMKNDIQQLEKGCVYSLHRVSKFIEPSLLLLLSKRGSHGYELLDRLGDLGFHRESIDVGSVYRTLRKLEKEGFVRSSWGEAKGRMKKRTYTITPQGIGLLARWADRIEERRRALAKFLAIYREDEGLR